MMMIVCCLRKYALFAGVICVLVVIKSGLETLANSPSNSASPSWEKSLGSAERR